MFSMFWGDLLWPTNCGQPKLWVKTPSKSDTSPPGASGAQNSLWDNSFYDFDHFCLFWIVHCSIFRADWTALLTRFLKKKGSRSNNWDKFIFSKIQRWRSLPLLSCTTSMNTLKWFEIVTNQLLKSLSVRTKFDISNISQFYLKRENLNQIGSNISATVFNSFKETTKE